MVVIEMNPRVSRSSALASKATGFPIAKVAARLAVGYTLDEIENDITGGATPASFEPTIDYVVTKIPRFAFEKFPGAEPTLTTAMKSVGEAMAIGRTFQESLQKALRSLETGLDRPRRDRDRGPRARATTRTPSRSPRWLDADARTGSSRSRRRCASASATTRFMRRLQDRSLVPRADARHRRQVEETIREFGLPETPGACAAAQGDGLLRQAARRWPAGKTKLEVRALRAFARRPPGLQAHRHLRRRVRLAHRLHVLDLRCPSSAADDEAEPTDRKKVIILGGGPNRIGQGIEFDYCCCHACYRAREAGYETIMVNCNPETVSTDYDTSDRLYFEPLTAEDVLEILETEKQNGTLHGVIVQFGGQTPLKLANALEEAGVPILGTSPDAIDLAEDRDRFKRLLDKLQLKQPKNGIAYLGRAGPPRSWPRLGLPFVVRPSYVLGGRAMADHPRRGHVRGLPARHTALADPLRRQGAYPNDKTGQINTVLGKPTRCCSTAICRTPSRSMSTVSPTARNVFIAGIMEHIEEAGIHSGDSACSLPPRSLSPETIAELERQTAPWRWRSRSSA